MAIDAGYRNIDIDSSTLVDLSKSTVDEQQGENYRRAAELTELIRTLESDGVTVSVGGEIGEVGTQNSTVEELRAYLDGYRRELERRAPGAKGISKVSVRPGPRTEASRCPTAESPRSSYGECHRFSYRGTLRTYLRGLGSDHTHVFFDGAALCDPACLPQPVRHWTRSLSGCLGK